MLIELLVKRDGPSPVFLGNVQYLFMPYRPKGEKGAVTSIADITSEEHLKHIAKFPNSYREFKEGVPLPEGLSTVVVNLSGFSIEKTADGKGYLAVKKKRSGTDGKMIEAAAFSGSNESWLAERDVASRTPFDTEFAAYQWLKEEVAFMEAEAEEEPAGEFDCPECGKVCANASGLSAHMRSHKES